MKKLLLTLVIITAITKTVVSQEKLTYTEVVQIEDISQNELYNRAKIWFATVYNSSNDVLQIENKEEGEIIGKAIMKYNPNIFAGSETTKGNIKYTIKLFFREGRYKYEITDFFHDPNGYNYNKKSMGFITTAIECPDPKPMAKGWSNRVWDDIKSEIEKNINNIIVSLKNEMSKTAESQKNDW